jgi:phospholipid N-methyltransferase
MARGLALADTDWLMFLRRWLRNPLTVGAIAPSSDALAQAMVSATAALTGPILELGAGTGVFTRALLRAGLPREHLHVVERLPGFADALRRRFPGVHIIHADAAELGADQLPAPVHGIVSGLPLRAMPDSQIERIVRAALRCARSDAAFVQFSYGWRCPVPSRIQTRLGIDAERVSWVGRNLPPASVWRLRSDNTTNERSDSGA